MACKSSLLLLVLLLPVDCTVHGKQMIGVNYGQLGNDLPSPWRAVQRIRRMGIGHVKIYDANPAILQALRHTTITVAVMVPNADVPVLAANQSAADAWIQRNVSAHYPATRIRTILLGNELLSDVNLANSTWPVIVEAMENVRMALRRHGLRHRVKVSTTLAMDILQSSRIFPPSNATFRENIREVVMEPLLRFLSKTRSPLFVDVYPYFAWANNAASVQLDFSLFGDVEARSGVASNVSHYRDPGTGLVYRNLLDVQLDAVVHAMKRLGFDDVAFTLSETGWPTKQGIDERGANVHNAALYNRRLVRKMLLSPPLGTPLRPGISIPTYIFALFNENEKPGPTTERNWGLLYPNGTRVYEVDLRGRLLDSAYPPLPPAPQDLPVGSLTLWCMANANASTASVEAGMAYACAQSPTICAGIQPGQPCASANSTLHNRASFAFNNYYREFKALGGYCSFGGIAKLTLQDPSYGSCVYTPLVF